MHGYFAGHGYAAIRVDMRGSGESDGLLDDEYLQQELDDACEVIAWLAAQPWCSGNVGMMGKSWGGFNCAAGRGAPAAGAEGDHHRLLDRRSLCRRHPLHGRLRCSTTICGGARSCSPTRRGRPIRSSSATAGATHWLERLDAHAVLAGALARSISAATTIGGTARSARISRRSTARSSPSAAGPTPTPTPSRACWRASRCRGSA